MYVAGTVENVERVTVDIGTGFYVDMTVEDAKGHFKRKVEYLTKQMEKIQPLLQDKFRMKQSKWKLVIEMEGTRFITCSAFFYFNLKWLQFKQL